MIGKTISHYKILERLGEGGMGVVYKAEDTKLKRTIVLKFLTIELTKAPEAKERFEREAQVAAALSHPNLITIFEIGEFEGQSYIAMEYVKGNSLRYELERGTIDIDRIVDITKQICRGLHEAHKVGIVHRDIKPENILIDKTGCVKILDFGLAKVQDATRLTKGESILGTPEYMSPEQLMGQELDSRSDIWSLGVVLYEMITGQLPFKGEYRQALIYSILSEDPESVLSLRKDIPEKFDRIVFNSLQKKSDVRYKNINEMLKDLRSLNRKGQKAKKATKSLPKKEKVISQLKRIGNYKLLESIGEGGMGIVYLAEQTEPVKRRVALKIIKLGMDTRQVVARFEAERQALAVMDHPNIAKVYDAGSTETGRPYFVMELVRGVSITEYSDKHKLTTRERLELFIPICHAIQHAHQKGVVHRDLKPSNVLVTVQEDKPVPKIIDFGIAKAIEHRLTERTLFTEQGQLIGTPEYMSPEQAEMSGLDVDTRTDIYSLGVMLYELMVGALPFDPETLRKAGFSEIQRIIRETDPPKASTRLSSLVNTQTSIAEHRKTDPASLHKQLKGDLDWITMKAMEKDRTQRYASASELVADIERHLKHEPILASPPSTIYRLRKYMRRHKMGVMASALVIMAVLIGITGTTIGLIRARKAEQVAKDEASKAKTINEFLQETLGSANPIEGSSRDITVLEALKTATEKIQEDFAEQPEVEAELKHTIGVTYLRLGRYEEAERLLRSSLKIWQDLRGPDHPDLASPLTSLGVLRHERDDYEEAESLYRKALVIKRKQHGGDENEDVMSILNNIALLLQDKGDLPAAEPIFRKILEIDRKLWGKEHLYVAIDLNNLGKLLLVKKNYVASEPILRESIDILRKEQHPWLCIVLGNLGELLTEKGDYLAAEPIFVEALKIGQNQLGDKNQDVAKLRSKYGLCLIKLKHFEKAEEQLLVAFPILRDSLGEHNEWTQKTIRYFINLYKAWGKEEKAAEYRALLPSNGK